ncbi:hypothetical protein H2200_003331 [Cladophialophora chaetospira]|uniref:AAA+ ATPase domain-containing protein n=1 Tax=Cladophialophora chaetospira TaxID=386627 RepID=A0AA38XI12_9EURO|nr:hypothetical protein H2200_003331 [Cladophialophora chaetospira]
MSADPRDTITSCLNNAWRTSHTPTFGEGQSPNGGLFPNERCTTPSTICIPSLNTPETSSDGDSLNPKTKCPRTASDAPQTATAGTDQIEAPASPVASDLSVVLVDQHPRLGGYEIPDVCIDNICKTAVSDLELLAGRSVSKSFTGGLSFLLDLEQRLARLEGVRSPPEKTDLTIDEILGNVDTHGTKNVIRDVTFFHAGEAIDDSGDFVSNFHQKGVFTSSTDPDNIIRVVYEWSADVAPKTSQPAATSPPEPGDVEVVAFAVLSEPLAEFYRRRLGLSSDCPVLRFVKPFRSVIRNLSELKRHLMYLEGKFGAATHDDDPEINKTKPETLLNAQGINTSPPRVDNGSVSENSERIEEVFNSLDALLDFRTLFNFLEKYLAKQIGLFQRLTHASSRLENSIAFENLWMLFETGVSIYCPYRDGNVNIFDNSSSDDEFFDGKEINVTKARYVPQAFQVLCTKGGLPLQNTMAPRGSRIDEYEDGGGIFGRSHSARSNPERLLVRGDMDVQLSKPGIPRSQRKGNFSPLIVSCFYVDFDGVRYGAVHEIMVFKPYNGLMDIKSLEAYPTKYLQTAPGRYSHSEILSADMLLQRGRKFVEATAVSHMSYEGLTLGKGREEITSEVIVDLKLAFQEYNEHSLWDHSTIVPKFSNHFNRLGPPLPRDEVYEFWTLKDHLCGKKWCSSLKCFDDRYYRILDDRVRKIFTNLKSLLEEYQLRDLDQADGLHKIKQSMEENDLISLLPGNGNDTYTRNAGYELELANASSQGGYGLSTGKGGCIILLHGEPGVGKTSTAECVAAFTRRPLYPITCGDLGHTPQNVEYNMEKHFKLAQRWGCVLLLDEADVFLAKRDTKRIWRNNLERLKTVNAEREQNGQPSIECDKKEILKWAESKSEALNWNGRQIRNAFQTAVALAEFTVQESSEEGCPSPKHPVMKKKHFKLIAAASKEFTKYLYEIHGADEEKRAERDKYRTTKGWDPKKSKDTLGDGDSDSSSSEDSTKKGKSDSSSGDSDSETEKKSKRSKGKTSGDEETGSSDEDKKSKRSKRKPDSKLRSAKEEKMKEKKKSK